MLPAGEMGRVPAAAVSVPGNAGRGPGDPAVARASRGESGLGDPRRGHRGGAP